MAIKDLEGYVPEVSLRYFESSVLPPLSPEQLTQLSAAISPLVNTEEDRWTSFDTDPCDTEGVEDVVFAPFPVLLNSIIDAVAEDLGHAKGHAAWKAQGRPTEVLHFENNPHATLKPDAFAALRILRGLGMPPQTLKVLFKRLSPPLLWMLMLVILSVSLQMSLRMPPMWFSFANLRRRTVQKMFLM